MFLLRLDLVGEKLYQRQLVPDPNLLQHLVAKPLRHRVKFPSMIVSELVTVQELKT